MNRYHIYMSRTNRNTLEPQEFEYSIITDLTHLCAEIADFVLQFDNINWTPWTVVQVKEMGEEHEGTC